MSSTPPSPTAAGTKDRESETPASTLGASATDGPAENGPAEDGPAGGASTEDGAARLAPDPDGSPDRLPDGPAGQTPPLPRITLRGCLIVGGLWVLYAVLYAILLARAENVPLAYGLAGQLMNSAILAAASVPAWWITMRTLRDVGVVPLLAVHVVLALAYAGGTLQAYLFATEAVAGTTVAAELRARASWIFSTHLTLYAIQFIGFHLTHSMQRLRWRERESAEWAALARERELAALKAQINPHFLFNTLNSINASVRADPSAARKMIVELSHLLRHALDSSTRDTVPLRQEVTFARAYLDLESRRFSDRLRVTYEIPADSNALDVAVSPMMLQPLVENAVRHGISPSPEGGTVTLRITADAQAVRIDVIDDGVGPSEQVARRIEAAGGSIRVDALQDLLADERSDATSTGFGLANTHARLVRMNGPDAGLHVQNVSPHGFHVWCTIPRT